MRIVLEDKVSKLVKLEIIERYLTLSLRFMTCPNLQPAYNHLT